MADVERARHLIAGDEDLGVVEGYVVDLCVSAEAPAVECGEHGVDAFASPVLVSRTTWYAALDASRGRAGRQATPAPRRALHLRSRARVRGRDPPRARRRLPRPLRREPGVASSRSAWSTPARTKRETSPKVISRMSPSRRRAPCRWPARSAPGTQRGQRSDDRPRWGPLRLQDSAPPLARVRRERAHNHDRRV